MNNCNNNCEINVTTYRISHRIFKTEVDENWLYEFEFLPIIDDVKILETRISNIVITVIVDDTVRTMIANCHIAWFNDSVRNFVDLFYSKYHE